MAMFGRFPGVLVTPEEITNLSIQQLTYFELNFAFRLERAWKSSSNVQRHLKMLSDPAFEKTCMLAAIFAAGRMQGIREERQKHRRQREAQKCVIDDLNDEKLRNS